MRWLELSLCVSGEAAEAIAALLGRYGHQGVVIEQNGIPPDAWDDGAAQTPSSLTLRAWFPEDQHNQELRLQLESALGHMSLMVPVPLPDWRYVDDDDWAEAWKAHYHPLRIGHRLLVRPEWIAQEVNADEVEIVLDPGMAFGTGTHPSTQLCLQALETRVRAGDKVLDLGCGSGILAIAAARLGAASVLALDNDPVAVTAARKNIALNPAVVRVCAQEGSLDSLRDTGQRFDLIVVNILAHIIARFCEEGLAETLRPGGCGIFSGIINDQAEEVASALRRAGLAPVARLQQDDWVALVARRQTDLRLRQDDQG